MLPTKDQPFRGYPQKGPAWSAARELCDTTASKLASYMHLNPYRTRILSWKIATGRREEDDLSENVMVKWGNDHEDIARKEYEQATGYTVYETGMWFDNRHNIGASPDGIIEMEDGTLRLLEIKCPWLRVLHDGVPERYMPQLQAGMHIVGCATCDYVCWTPTGTRVTTVKRDPEYYTTRILPAVKDFLHYVREDIQPPRNNKRKRV